MTLPLHLFLRRHRLAAVCALVGAIGGFAYARLASPIYQAVGMAALERPHVEIPNASNEDLKNRWVWVRDGLALQQALISDDFLVSLISTVPAMNERFAHFSTQTGYHRENVSERDLRLAFSEHLRREIQVDYTGGDANGFVITVRDGQATVARDIAAAALARLRSLALDAVADEYSRTRHALEGRPESKAIESARLAQQAYAEGAFRILREPFEPLRPVWPRRDLLLALGIFFGALVGMALEFLLGRKGISRGPIQPPRTPYSRSVRLKSGDRV
jgi:hypothetical protein